VSTVMHGHGNVMGDGNTVKVIVNGREETRLFVNVPPKPALLVGRDESLRNLKTRLMNNAATDATASSAVATAGPTAAISAVRGLAGVGKTTLAAVLAHDPTCSRTLAVVCTTCWAITAGRWRPTRRRWRCGARWATGRGKGPR